MHHEEGRLTAQKGDRGAGIVQRFDRPDVHSVEEVVTTALRDAILSGELRPGERLLQEQLADELRVSRIPLRDALRRLESEGLVHIGPRRGAEVASLSADDVREIYELRIALEPPLMREAIAALNETDIKRLVELSAQMDEHRDEPSKGSRARRRFYNELYSHTRRPRTRRLILTLCDDVHRYHVMKNVRGALHDHAELRDAIRAKDADRAARIYAEHLRHACADLAEVLERESAG